MISGAGNYDVARVTSETIQQENGDGTVRSSPPGSHNPITGVCISVSMTLRF